MNKTKALEKRIRKKLKNEEPLTREEYSHVFRDDPYIVALFDQASLVQELIKKWR